MNFEEAYAQLDYLYGDVELMIVNRWLYNGKTEVYHVVYVDRWGWLKIEAAEVRADKFYPLLNTIRYTPGPFPYVKDHPEFWHVETPDSFLDYLRDHLTKKGRFKKCI